MTRAIVLGATLGATVLCGLLGATVLSTALLPSRAAARPVPTIHPGGPTAAPDSIVLEFPARRAPSLLALRAMAPLAALGGRAGVDPAATL
ncbi:MAG TPA: hypothetical protein VJW75_07065, partial [Candidatus Eisenbacteria bacterium]|nr:hypothetical protein [Candidatus Eisenbacteria bacterium]